MKVYLAMGAYRYQGQEVLNVYDTHAAAQAECDQQADAFDATYVIEREVLTETQPLNV